MPVVSYLANTTRNWASKTLSDGIIDISENNSDNDHRSYDSTRQDEILRKQLPPLRSTQQWSSQSLHFASSLKMRCEKWEHIPPQSPCLPCYSTQIPHLLTLHSNNSESSIESLDSSARDDNSPALSSVVSTDSVFPCLIECSTEHRLERPILSRLDTSTSQNSISANSPPPPYCCAIYLETYALRKPEQSSPGVLVPDRKWHSEYIAVRGTLLMVWKYDFKSHPVPNSGWVSENAPVNRQEMTRSRHGGRRYFHEMEAFQDMPRPHTSFDPKHFLMQLRRRSSETSNVLLKTYTLQYAECGIASEYPVEKNVVRVRAEGEQFLLKVKTARIAVDLVETIQAGINVSVDLDSRGIPIFRIPRRRREELGQGPQSHDRERLETGNSVPMDSDVLC